TVVGAAIVRPADDGGAAVVRQRDGKALHNVGRGTGVAAAQLRRLAPHAAAAGEYPRRAERAVVGPAADDGGVAVGGERAGVGKRGPAGHAGLRAIGPGRAVATEL